MIRFLLAFVATPLCSETVVATRTIPANTVISSEDLSIRDIDVPGAAIDPDELIGMESRVALYAGRPISPADVGFPATVERNQIVTLIFQRGNVVISTDGRSLDRAGPGDTARVMNLSSRSTVTAKIGIDGAAYVGF